MKTFLALIVIIGVGYLISYITFEISPINKEWLIMPTTFFVLIGYTIGSIALIALANDKD